MTNRHLHLATSADAQELPLMPQPALNLTKQVFEVLDVERVFRSYGTPLEISRMVCRRCGNRARIAAVRLERHLAISDACEPSNHPWFRRTLPILLPWCSVCGDTAPSPYGCYHVDHFGLVVSVSFQIEIMGELTPPSA